MQRWKTLWPPLHRELNTEKEKENVLPLLMRSYPNQSGCKEQHLNAHPSLSYERKYSPWFLMEKSHGLFALLSRKP